MSLSITVGLLSSSLFAQAGGSHDSAPILWESTFVRDAPQMDGQRDPIWSKAKPLTVHIREAMGGDHPRPVILRALHTADSLYIAAEWDDATRSDMRDPYIWNAAQKKYDRPSKPDDQFAIEFPISGDFAISMMTVQHEYKADVWHWKAGRGNPIGWVDDKYHVISQSPVPNAKEHKLHSGRRVFIARVQDAGKSPYAVKPEPAVFGGDIVDSFQQQPPDGSMADIHGKGQHNGKGWFLEIGRRFNTGHSDDAAIDPKKDTPCAIAVLNDELYEEHSVSSLIHLRFRGGPGRK